MRTATLAIALLASAAPARAGETWATAVDSGARLGTVEAYTQAMARGDEATLRAAAGASNSRTIVKYVEAAVLAYEQAAKLRPKEAEPHYRAGNVLFGFYLDSCEDPKPPYCFDFRDDFKRFEKQARRVIAHWDAFEKLAPLDPRLQPGPRSASIVFERAILRTKLATDADLRLAIVDYETLLERWPGPTNDAHVRTNLAEALMMVGDLDRSIERYREEIALTGVGDIGTSYGLAVAYARDGQGGKAREVIRALGKETFERWTELVQAGLYFYVPEGEEHYYYALAHEALGHFARAAKSWKEFIASGAHPRYHARAKENLKAVQKRLGGAGKR